MSRKTPRCSAIPCKQVWAVTFQPSGEAWCFGRRSAKKARPCDVVAHCELDSKGKRIAGFDVTIDEAALIIQGLAAGIAVATEGAHERCRRKICSEYAACKNGGRRSRA